jgi:hypothetical protein
MNLSRLAASSDQLVRSGCHRPVRTSTTWCDCGNAKGCGTCRCNSRPVCTASRAIKSLDDHQAYAKHSRSRSGARALTCSAAARVTFVKPVYERVLGAVVPAVLTPPPQLITECHAICVATATCCQEAGLQKGRPNNKAALMSDWEGFTYWWPTHRHTKTCQN